MKIKKIWKRILLLLIVVPIVFLAGLVLYIQSNQAEIIKSEIEKLNKEYKGLTRIGDSKLSLFGNFPYISLKLLDVQIFETKKENSPVIVDVKEIYIGLNISDIMTGNYDIQSLRVEDGRLNLVVHENGISNLSNSLSNLDSKTSPNDSMTSSTKIHLKKIKLKTLAIYSFDVANNTTTEIQINTGKGGFNLTENSVSGHIDTDFDYKLTSGKDTPIVNKKHFEFHTDVMFDKNSGIIDIQPSGLIMENGHFNLEGSVNTKSKNLDLSVKGVKPNFDMFIAFAPADVIKVLEGYKNAGEVYFNARINGPFGNGKMPFINADFGAGKAYLENTDSAKKIDKMGFTGHFTNGKQRDASTMEFSLSEMTAALGKGIFKGSIVVKNFESPEVDMQIDSEFDLEFITEFLELEQVEDASGQVSLKMNFHDIIDIDDPEKALQKINQAYFTELIVKNVSLVAKKLPAPLRDLNVHLVMKGKEAYLNQFEVLMGNSDLSIRGVLSDLPAIVHHTKIPIEAHLDITSDHLDIAQLTRFSKQDSTQTGIDEQIKNLGLGLSFKTSARDVTESKYLPKGEFFIDSLYADLKHYPHKLHDFHADILIDDKDLEIKDFTGYIDDSDFHFDGLIHEYAFWLKPELKGDVDLDINLTSKKLKLEDVFSYNGKNYVPEEYRREEFDDFTLHFNSSMHYKDSVLHSIDVSLDKLDTKMKLHPLRFTNFRGNIHYEEKKLKINDFHGEIGSTNFIFDLNYYLGQNQQIKKRENYLELKADRIDFDALFNFDVDEPKPAEVAALNAANAQTHADAFNIYEVPFTDMQFKLDVAHFIYHSIDLQNIKANLRITPDHFVYVDTLNMNAAGGDIRLSGYLNGSNPNDIYMQPDLVIDNVDLDKLEFKFENSGQDHLISENIEGKLTTNLKGSIKVYPDMVPNLDQSAVEMNVTLLNGRLKNYNPMLVLSDYVGDKNLQNIRFDTLQNSLYLKNGKLTIPTMTIESSLGHLELSGTHDNDQNIEYYIRIPMKTVRKAAWRKLFKNKNNSISDPTQEDEIIRLDPNKKTKYLNLKIEGKVDDYKVSLGKNKNKDQLLNK